MRDGTLRCSWGRYRSVVRRHRAMSATGDDRAKASVDRELLHIEERFATLPARTLAGVVLKLRFLFLALEGSPEAEAAVLAGAPLTVETLPDYRLRALWSLIGDIEALQGRRRW